jgi:ubiquinone/menaquinone biosynthesis C-methylase UbiE
MRFYKLYGIYLSPKQQLFYKDSHSSHSMNYYDDLAPGYDELHKAEQLRKLTIIIDILTTTTLQEGPLLDVGCGTGFSLDILEEKTGKTCTGAEPSAGMIAQHQGRAKIHHAPAEELPFEDATFCATISVTAVQNFSDLYAGIEEIIRVTKPEGLIIITCLKKSPKAKTVAEILGERIVVKEVIEEDKDLIFVCEKRTV